MYVDILKKLEILIAIQQNMLALLANAGATPYLDEEELLDSTDIKKLLKISDSSLYRLRRTKQIKCRQIAGKWYYFKSSILQK